MDQFFQTVADKLKYYDNQLAGIIEKFLKSYLIPPEGLSFSSNIPLFVRITIYLILLLIPLSLIKLFFIDSHKLSVFLALLVTAIGFLIIGVIFGFFQLLYDFQVL